MQQQQLRPLRSPDKRRHNKFIILSHIGNFSLRHRPMNPELEGYLPYYTGKRIENYFFEHLEKRLLPYHYHVNMITGDWQVGVSAPISAKSNMIEECISNGYMDSFYKDAIVIAIQDDYSLRIPELRTFEVMSSKIIAPLLHSMKLGNYRDTVFWFDEVFNYEKYNRDMETNSLDNPYPFKVKPMKYFDRVQFNLETRRFI